MNDPKLDVGASSKEGAFNAKNNAASNGTGRKRKPNHVRVVEAALKLEDFSGTTMHLLNPEDVVGQQQELQGGQLHASSGGVIVGHGAEEGACVPCCA